MSLRRRRPRQAIDLDSVASWAEKLDESIGTDEVSVRLARALAISRRRR